MHGELRPGIILTVTGIVVLAHYFLVPGGTPGVHVSRRTRLLIAIVLIVLGIPLFVVGALGGL